MKKHNLMPNQVVVFIQWFFDLQDMAKKFKENPTLKNRNKLLDTINMAVDVIKENI